MSQLLKLKQGQTDKTQVGTGEDRDEQGLLINPAGAKFDRNTGLAIGQQETSIDKLIPEAESTVLPDWLATLEERYKKDLEEPVDEEKIRREQLAGMADRINQLNLIYNDQLAKAAEQQRGRMGSAGAFLAARGFTGSPIGQGYEGQIRAKGEEEISKRTISRK